MNSITNNTGTRSIQGSSSNQAAHYPYKQTEASAQIELHPLGSGHAHGAHETEGEASPQNEIFAPPNTGQGGEDSNGISLQLALIKASIHHLATHIEINNLSWLKRNTLPKEKLKYIQEKVDEAKSKLIELYSANNRIRVITDPKNKIFSEEELERLEEPEKLEKLEERLKELVGLKELLTQQLAGLKNADENTLKFLADLDAYLNGKDPDEFLKLKWITRTLPLASVFSTSIVNILQRKTFISWCITALTNLITWGINDVFIPLKNTPQRYQTEDLKALTEKVFSATLLYSLKQRVIAEEKKIKSEEQEISNLRQRIKDMETANIVSIRAATESMAHTLTQGQSELVQSQNELAARELRLEQTLAQRDAEHARVIQELSVQHTEEMSKLAEEMSNLKNDMATIIREEIAKAIGKTV